ncbi:MAG: hypothetical protein J1E40_00805 [Oscillospiraceae bacterium]|nr:hypothetical protein [Oscillospiraceae bacterium]
MKKLFAGAAAAALALSMSTTAFAAAEPTEIPFDGEDDTTIANMTGEGVTAQIPVTATVSGASGAKEKVYALDIEWTGFAYTFEFDEISGEAPKAAVWDPEEHEYTANASQASKLSGTWAQDDTKGEESTISFLNHSNAKINVKAALDETLETFGFYFDEDTVNLESAEGIAKETEDGLNSGKLTMTAPATGTKGNTPPAVNGEVNIGTVTLTIKDADA